MARLHEHQGKQTLKAHGIAVPAGMLCRGTEESRRAAETLGCPVVVKAQVWETGRARAGGIRFAAAPADAFLETTETVLVEERVPVDREFYAGYIIDDRLRRPVLLFSPAGGSGVEERRDSVARLAISVSVEPPLAEVAEFVRRAGAPDSAAEVLLNLCRAARACEATSAEINPLALTPDGRWVALDCRISVDDYAVFRHPELDIEVARELGHPPTELERLAWLVERDDYRGTFYFVEVPEDGPGIRVGFHGFGGGGSMAGLDAAARAGLRAADYTDTSGNPPASKVYRAARIILSLPGLRGYFLSGPGVASQEQYHSARGLVKAFREAPLAVPAVLRLGGNGEDRALEIVRRYAAETSVPVEAYGKDDSADFCAQRLRELIEREAPVPSGAGFQPARARSALSTPYVFATRTGTIAYDHAVCADCESKACVTECVPQILSLSNGLPVLNISRAEAARGRCIECLACEVECWYAGKGGARIDLPWPS